MSKNLSVISGSMGDVNVSVSLIILTDKNPGGIAAVGTKRNIILIYESLITSSIE